MKTSQNILLVEDNRQDELLVLRTLERARVANRIDVVRDGQQALDYLLGPEGEARALPAVVLLDIGLPRVSGLEVLRQVRADPRTRRLPVVILTSSDEERDRMSSYDLGANSYVRKPVDFGRFGEAVANLGIYWLAVNDPP